MSSIQPFIISIIGHRSELKDQLAIDLLTQLQQNNYHCFFDKKAKSLDFDTKGKDSYELFAAGLDYISLVTSKNRYLRSKHDLSAVIDSAHYDCVVLFNKTDHADITVMVDADKGIKANLDYDVLVSSLDIETKCPQFNRDNLSQFFNWIINKMKEKQITSCCDYCPSDLDIEVAQQKIIEQCQRVKETERLPLQLALGRVLSNDLVASISTPPNDNSAMDGYAFYLDGSEDCTQKPFEIIGKSMAGAPFSGEVKKGQTVRIMTGAKIPKGANAVIMQERAELSADQKTVSFNQSIKVGQNIRQKGEDIEKGEVFLKAGTVLTPACIGVIASMGISEVFVYRKVKVAVISTGDELQSIGSLLEDGNIYDSNRYSLGALLDDPCVEVIQKGVMSDQAENIEQLFLEVAEYVDVILTTGGVSVGEADWVKSCIDKTGEMIFWRVAIKPGRPLAFAKVKNSLLFGLPGNPVSVMITYEKFARIGIDLLSGKKLTQSIELQVKSKSNIRKVAGRVEFQRGILKKDENGELTVMTTGDQGSGILSSMSSANCLIVLAKDDESVLAGEMVTVQPFSIYL